MNAMAEKVWGEIKASETPEEADILACQSDSGCLPLIVSKWQTATLEIRKRILLTFPYLGGQWQPAQGDVPGQFGLYVTKPVLVEGLVEALGDPDPEIRNGAGRMLALVTPDSLVRDHAIPIEKSLRARPDIDKAALLLGKIGSERALRFLEESEAVKSGDPREIQAAFGKLGDTAKENALIDAYLSEREPKIKKRRAWFLAYVGRPKSLLILARELRTPYFYEWNQKAKRSFRIHVIEALSSAFPQEALLWRPVFIPTDDTYYSKLEAWAERVLGVQWESPRPPFLYEQQAPMSKPAPHR